MMFVGCFAVLWSAMPLTAVVSFGQRITAPAEERSEESRSEEERSVLRELEPVRGSERGRTGRIHRCPPFRLPGPVVTGHFTYSRSDLIDISPDPGRALRNGLGTFYRC
jgi:hypothetical protein